MKNTDSQITRSAGGGGENNWSSSIDFQIKTTTAFCVLFSSIDLKIFVMTNTNEKAKQTKPHTSPH